MTHLRFFCFLGLCLILLSVPVRAADADLHAQLDTDSIWAVLPEETRELLSASDMHPENMENASVPAFITSLADKISEELYAPIKIGLHLVSLVILGRIICEFGSDALHHVVQLCTAFCATTLLIQPISMLIKQTEQLVGTLTAVLTASIPIYTGILVMSGNAMTGSTYGALTLSWGSSVSAIARQLLLPVTRIYFVFSITAAISDFGLKRITDALYRSVKWILILAVTVFTGILSLQTLLSAQSDAATTKAIKLVASGAVPIVGSAFSDAFSVIRASVGVVKSGIGAFGLLASLAIFLPVCLKASGWILTGITAAFVADLLEMDRFSDLMTGCVSVLKMLMAVLCSVGFISLVAAAVLLCVRSAYG